MSVGFSETDRMPKAINSVEYGGGTVQQTKAKSTQPPSIWGIAPKDSEAKKDKEDIKEEKDRDKIEAAKQKLNYDADGKPKKPGFFRGIFYPSMKTAYEEALQEYESGKTDKVETSSTGLNTEA